MPVLSNPKHELFAQELAKGKSQAEAYKAAGYKPSEPNASRLTSNEKVSARVAELLGRAADGVVLTKQWVIERLIENAERAMQAKAALNDSGETVGEYQYQGSVANRALELLGKEVGMFVDRKEVGKPGDFSRVSDDELDAFIAGRQGTVGGGNSREATAPVQKGVRKSSGLH